mgnify:FL=1
MDDDDASEIIHSTNNGLDPAVQDFLGQSTETNENEKENSYTSNDDHSENDNHPDYTRRWHPVLITHDRSEHYLAVADAECYVNIYSIAPGHPVTSVKCFRLDVETYIDERGQEKTAKFITAIDFMSNPAFINVATDTHLLTYHLAPNEPVVVAEWKLTEGLTDSVSYLSSSTATGGGGENGELKMGKIIVSFVGDIAPHVYDPNDSTCTKLVAPHVKANTTTTSIFLTTNGVTSGSTCTGNGNQIVLSVSELSNTEEGTHSSQVLSLSLPEKSKEPSSQEPSSQEPSSQEPSSQEPSSLIASCPLLTNEILRKGGLVGQTNLTSTIRLNKRGDKVVIGGRCLNFKQIRVYSVSSDGQLELFGTYKGLGQHGHKLKTPLMIGGGFGRGDEGDEIVYSNPCWWVKDANNIQNKIDVWDVAEYTNKATEMGKELNNAVAQKNTEDNVMKMNDTPAMSIPTAERAKFFRGISFAGGRMFGVGADGGMYYAGEEEKEGSWPGAMYPPGYAIVTDNFDYIEAEDELDTVLDSVKEGFDVYENVGLARPKKKNGDELSEEEQREEELKKQLEKERMAKRDETKVTFERGKEFKTVVILKNDQDKVIDIVGSDGGGSTANIDEFAAGFWPIAASPDEDIAKKANTIHTNKQAELSRYKNPSDVKMSFKNWSGKNNAQTTTQILALLPSNKDHETPNSNNLSQRSKMNTAASQEFGGGSSFDASNCIPGSSCPACNGRSTYHRCGRRFLPSYDPTFGEKKKGGKREQKRCNKCAGCRRTVNCGRCKTCKNKPEFGGFSLKAELCELKKCIGAGREICIPVSNFISSPGMGTVSGFSSVGAVKPEKFGNGNSNGNGNSTSHVPDNGNQQFDNTNYKETSLMPPAPYSTLDEAFSAVTKDRQIFEVTLGPTESQEKLGLTVVDNNNLPGLLVLSAKSDSLIGSKDSRIEEGALLLKVNGIMLTCREKFLEAIKQFQDYLKTHPDSQITFTFGTRFP